MKPSDPVEPASDSERTVIRPSPGGPRPHASTIAVAPATLPAGFDLPSETVDMPGDNPLLVCAYSLLSLVSKLRNLTCHEAVNTLRERLIGEIKKFSNRALQKGVDRNQVDTARYLLCSLIDETVLNTPWGSRSGWGHNSLSSLFYKKLAGGEEFFQIIDKLKQQLSQNQHLLELAYMCLSLGFEGKYRYTNNGLITLERQRQELYLLIRREDNDALPELSNRWRGVREVSNPLIRHVPLWVLACIAGAALMLIYMVFAFAIRNASDGLYGDMVAMAHQMKKAPPVQLVQPIVVQPPRVLPDNRFKTLLAEEITQKKVAIIDNHGLRIFNMFQSGSAEIRSEYRPILKKIAQELQKDNVRMLITGHTDSQRLKFSTRFKSNWHLSLARAERTASVLGSYGLPGEHIRMEAMADKDPIAPNDTKANRALNRRIDIYIR